MAGSVYILDAGTPALAGLRQAMAPRAVRAQVGAAVQALIQRHLIGLPPNKKGFPSQGFYGQAARATSWRDVGSALVVSINKQGFRQRFEGGTILPVNAKMLTIAEAPEAYGKRAREFDNLRCGMALNSQGHMAPALIETNATLVRIGKKRVKNLGPTGGKVMYWLVRSVTQRPDPTVLPTDAQILNACTATVESYAARQNAGNQ